MQSTFINVYSFSTAIVQGKLLSKQNKTKQNKTKQLLNRGFPTISLSFLIRVKIARLSSTATAASFLSAAHSVNKQPHIDEFHYVENISAALF